MFSVGNEELAAAPELEETIVCTRCGELHEVLYGEIVERDGTKVPSKDLSYVKCQGKLFLVGFQGKDIRR